MLLDLVNETLNQNSIPPNIYSATTQGTALDFSNGEASTNMVVDATISTTANVTSFVVQLEECATTNGTFTAITSGSITITATTATTNLHQAVRCLRTLQYVRANMATFAATTTTNGIILTADIYAQKRQQPATGGYSLSPSS